MKHVKLLIGTAHILHGEIEFFTWRNGILCCHIVFTGSDSPKCHPDNLLKVSSEQQ